MLKTTFDLLFEPTMPVDRFNKNWYNKRIEDNIQIKDYLLNIIDKYRNKSFPFERDKLVYLNYEDLFEIAIASVNKKIQVILGEGQDWNDGKDGKVAVTRKNNYGKGYSALINCYNKDSIRALVYERITKKFYFFCFPLTEFKHKYKQLSVPFTPIGGAPRRDNWTWKYECKSFEEMARK